MIAKPKLPSAGTKVLVTGLTGQDGYYLAKLLSGAGCRVVAGVREAELPLGESIAAELNLAEVAPCELEDEGSVEGLIRAVRPAIVYHLAAQSSVRNSWELPLLTTRINAVGSLALLEALRRHCPGAGFVMAGSCDCFDHDVAGAGGVTPRTPFKVTNPYAATKVLAHQMTDCYRNEFGLRACVAIFFNHTSPRRPEMFVERGLVRNAVRVKLGKIEAVPIGSWETTRDWSWAPELMEGFAAMGNQTEAEDLVLAGGRTLTVGDWIVEAFRQLGLDPKTQVRVDPGRLHPGDRPHTFGNIERTREKLDWQPRMGLGEMVAELIAWDLDHADEL